jgi:glycosyltransferase involved in cell wall biosynthesis
LPDPVLFISFDLRAAGGGEAVAAWMIQTLADSWDLTVLTWQTPDFAALDRAFGTSLQTARFRVVTPNAFERWLISRIPDDSVLQKANYLYRLAKKMKGPFVVRIANAAVEADLGEPGIQYIHYPYLHNAGKHNIFSVPGDAPWPRRLRGIVNGQVRPWTMLSGFSFDRVHSNLTLTNSQWTRARIRQGGFESEVLYPPAPGAFHDIPWQQREESFVAVGRFHPVKRQDWIVETLAQVRRSRPGIRLHLCGFGLPALAAFTARLHSMAREQGDWVQVHENLSRSELLALVGRQK